MSKNVTKLFWALALAAIVGNAKVLFSMSDRLARIETKIEILCANRNIAKLP